MRIITLLFLFYSASIYAESIEFEIRDYTESNDGVVTAKGSKEYTPSDIQVSESLQGHDVHWGKTLSLPQGYAIGASIYREPEITGFGMWAKKGGAGFSWEWFDIDENGQFCKRQENGRVSVKYHEYKSEKEIIEVNFDTDVSLRINTSNDINKDTHRILIKKGSVLRFLPSVSSLDIAPSECAEGNKHVRAGSFKESMSLLTKCISSEKASLNAKRIAYEMRASANNALGDNHAAVEDIELAFQIQPPAQYYEFINYSLYLRLIGRAEDSLQIVKVAKMLDDAKGKTSMMTQYHLGWSYQELGRHQEAIEAFTLGVAKQPDYPYVYYRRSLSYEAIGTLDSARSDLEKVSELIKDSKWNHLPSKDLEPIKAKITQYGID